MKTLVFILLALASTATAPDYHYHRSHHPMKPGDSCYLCTGGLQHAAR